MAAPVLGGLAAAQTPRVARTRLTSLESDPVSRAHEERQRSPGGAPSYAWALVMGQGPPAFVGQVVLEGALCVPPGLPSTDDGVCEPRGLLPRPRSGRTLLTRLVTCWVSEFLILSALA